VKEALAKKGSEDEVLKKMHRLIYKTDGTRHGRKGEIRKWSGVNAAAKVCIYLFNNLFIWCVCWCMKERCWDGGIIYGQNAMYLSS
jgi:hypothetical protein